MTKNPDILTDQLAFQLTFGHGVLPIPQIPPQDIQLRRRMLVVEEMNSEFLLAWERCENASVDGRTGDAEALAALADAIADSIYVLVGTAYEYGIPLAAVWREVQRANMTKLWTLEEVHSQDAVLSPYNPHILTGWRWESVPGFPQTANSRYIRVLDEYGKVRKPPSWKPPDIVSIIKHCQNHPPAKLIPDEHARAEAAAEELYSPNPDPDQTTLPGYMNP